MKFLEINRTFFNLSGNIRKKLKVYSNIKLIQYNLIAKYIRKLGLFILRHLN